MRFKPTSAVAFACVACAMIVTSCATDVETDVNVDPAGNAISFAPSVGHSTRAEETTISNLGNFAVIARGMHHDGVLYDNFLIGSKTGGEIAERKGDLVTPEDPDQPISGTWKLSRSVYWPSSLEKVLFYAYTALKSGETCTNVFGTKEGETTPILGFDGDNPYIDGFRPSKLGVSSESGTNGIWADGKDQRDLLVAYTPQRRETSATDVKIEFQHALTQISIIGSQTNKADEDNRIVKIKGAWIVNAAESGKLSATYNKTDLTITNSWGVSGKTTYGSFYTDILNLSKDGDSELLRKHSLMLLPQNLEKWNLKDGTDNNGGAYILLLCRVELEHQGDNHTGTDIGDIAIENGKHYHQLFPVNETEFNGAQYGFVCVPLSSDWNTNGIGKKYTYNLNICGNGTGAGKYPPTMTQDDVNKLVPSGTKVAVVGNSEAQDLEVIISRPENKSVGDNVLDEPIQFTVTVNGWETPTGWTDGNIKL